MAMMPAAAANAANVIRITNLHENRAGGGRPAHDRVLSRLDFEMSTPPVEPLLNLPIELFEQRLVARIPVLKVAVLA